MQKHPSVYQQGTWIPLTLFLATILAGVLLTLYGTAAVRQWMRPAGPVVPAKNDPNPIPSDSDARPVPPDGPEMRLCCEFRNRKNAGDAAAADLLGPARVVPATAVAQGEADRLETEFFLRQDLRIVGVGWDASAEKPVLYTQGNVSAPTLHVKTETGVETAQRTMTNPDLVVEVRDGRIYGVAAHVHF